MLLLWLCALLLILFPADCSLASSFLATPPPRRRWRWRAGDDAGIQPHAAATTTALQRRSVVLAQLASSSSDDDKGSCSGKNSTTTAAAAAFFASGGDNDDDDDDDVTALLSQVEVLRAQAKAMEQEVAETKQARIAKAEANIDKWINDLLVLQTVGKTQILHSVEQVTNVLRDGRYSPEQVEQIFKRLTAGINRREQVDQTLQKTPLLELLVKACGQLDCVEREDNPNKRWNGRVERDLRKKLFALEWGINLEEEDGGDDTLSSFKE